MVVECSCCHRQNTGLRVSVRRPVRRMNLASLNHGFPLGLRLVLFWLAGFSEQCFLPCWNLSCLHDCCDFRRNQIQLPADQFDRLPEGMQQQHGFNDLCRSHDVHNCAASRSHDQRSNSSAADSAGFEAGSPSNAPRASGSMPRRLAKLASECPWRRRSRASSMMWPGM